MSTTQPDMTWAEAHAALSKHTKTYTICLTDTWVPIAGGRRVEYGVTGSIGNADPTHRTGATLREAVNWFLVSFTSPVPTPAQIDAQIGGDK